MILTDLSRRLIFNLFLHGLSFCNVLVANRK